MIKGSVKALPQVSKPSEKILKKLITSSSEDKDKSLAAAKSNEDLAQVMQPGSRLAVGIHVQHKNG